MAQNILAAKHTGALRLNSCHYWIKEKPGLSNLTQLFYFFKMCVPDSDPGAGAGQALALEEAGGRWSHELEGAQKAVSDGWEYR